MIKEKINPRKKREEVIINQFKIWLVSNGIYQKELSCNCFEKG